MALTAPVVFSIEDTASVAADGIDVDFAITEAANVTSTDNMTVEQAVAMLDGRDAIRNDYFDFTISDDYTTSPVQAAIRN